jgi:hypothetical protein
MRRFLPVEYLVFVTLFLPAGSSAAADAAIEDALRATVLITKGTSYGTGFFVAVGEPSDPKGSNPPRKIQGRRHAMVTAAHVFISSNGPDCTVFVRAHGKDGALVRKEITVPIREGNKPLWTQLLPELDVAAILVNVPEDVDLKPFAYRQVADEKWAADGKIRVGQQVRIPCFLQPPLLANEAGWPILRTGWIASHPLTPLASVKSMIIDYSIFPGDSGAPVVACDGEEPVVVGLVYGNVTHTDQSMMMFEQRTVVTSFRLATAVQSPFVRKTIDRLLERQ